MARVNLEERFFSEARLKRFASLMKWQIPTAIGTLALIWKESQEAMAVDATAEDIIFWAGIKSPKKGAALIAALSHERVRYLRENPSGRYTISGNYAQIDNRIAQIQKATKAGNANRVKWESLKDQGVKSGPGHLGDIPQDISGISFAMQSNAIQSNAVQGDAAGAAGKAGELDVPSLGEPGTGAQGATDFDRKLAEIRAREAARVATQRARELRYSEVVAEAKRRKETLTDVVNGVLIVPNGRVIDNTEKKILGIESGKPLEGFRTSDNVDRVKQNV